MPPFWQDVKLQLETLNQMILLGEQAPLGNLWRGNHAYHGPILTLVFPFRPHETEGSTQSRLPGDMAVYLRTVPPVREGTRRLDLGPSPWRWDMTAVSHSVLNDGRSRHKMAFASRPRHGRPIRIRCLQKVEGRWRGGSGVKGAERSATSLGPGHTSAGRKPMQTYLRYRRPRENLLASHLPTR